MNIQDVDTKRILDALYRKDLGLFTERAFYETNPNTVFDHNWHFDAIAHELKQVMDGKVRRLLITMPPRSLKSHSASVAFPAWVLGHNPAKRIVCVSYARDLAIELSNNTRKILDADWYKALFPATRIDPRKDTEMEVRTVKGGYRLSATIGGALTGRGGSIFIIDDPMKALDAMSDLARNKVNIWFDQTLMSRLDSKKNDAIIVIMQRLHVDDLAGHVLDHGGWRHLNLPAISEEKVRVQTGEDSYYKREAGELLHPSREPQEILDEIKEVLGSSGFSAQFQQQPVPPDGNLIKWKWFDYYTNLPEKKYNHKIVQSWDTASKSNELADYSVCVTALMTKEEFYILDVYRDRLDYPELKKKIIAMKKRFKADKLLIEDKGSGIGLIADLKADGVHSIGISPKVDKIVRVFTCLDKIEDGSVLLPNDAKWMDDFKVELLAFPNGKHDDQADALSQLINWEKTRSKYSLDNVS